MIAVELLKLTYYFGFLCKDMYLFPIRQTFCSLFFIFVNYFFYLLENITLELTNVNNIGDGMTNVNKWAFGRKKRRKSIAGLEK